MAKPSLIWKKIWDELAMESTRRLYQLCEEETNTKTRAKTQLYGAIIETNMIRVDEEIVENRLNEIRIKLVDNYERPRNKENIPSEENKQEYRETLRKEINNVKNKIKALKAKLDKELD